MIPLSQRVSLRTFSSKQSRLLRFEQPLEESSFAGWLPHSSANTQMALARSQSHYFRFSRANSQAPIPKNSAFGTHMTRCGYCSGLSLSPSAKMMIPM